MASFCSALQGCDLSDLGFMAGRYTWERGHFASTSIRERLDRGVTNSLWWDHFLDYSVSHLTHSISDHCQVLLDIESRQLSHHVRSSLQFQFQAEWCLDSSFLFVPYANLPAKLRGLGKRLGFWHRAQMRVRRATKENLEARLVDLQSQFSNDDTLGELNEIRLGLNLEVDQEEIF